MKAKLLAQQGALEEAERYAREAVELASGTDFVTDHGFALENLAEVLQMSGRPGDAVPEVERALRLYDAKGDTHSAARTRALLERLAP